MGARNSIVRNRTAFIEKNLNDLQFRIPEEEVKHIQNGIETLVIQIVNDMSKEFADKIEERKQTLINKAEKAGVKLKEIVSSEKLIKAGSFYEGTKNYFPNEFDFVFVLGTYKATECCALDNFLPCDNRYEVYFEHKQLLQMFFHHPLQKDYIYHFDNGLSELCFLHCIEIVGPALKIQFLYKKLEKDDIKINVDIVPATKIIDPFLTEEILNENKVCTIPEFHKFIVETGSYIAIHDGYVSFVETEQRFISTVLSPHHRELYRLVKHLINGADQEESLKTIREKEVYLHYLDISSFTIKTTLIWHHFRCTLYSQNTMHMKSHECAGEIMLDLQKHLYNACKRHLLTERELRIKSVSPCCLSKYSKLRSLGSKYLIMLGESLTPTPGRDQKHLYSKMDKSFSHYMLTNINKFQLLTDIF